MDGMSWLDFLCFDDMRMAIHVGMEMESLFEYLFPYTIHAFIDSNLNVLVGRVEPPVGLV